MNKTWLIPTLIVLSLYLANDVPLIVRNSDCDLIFQIQTIFDSTNQIYNTEPLVLQTQGKYHNLTEVYLELENFNQNAPHLIDYTTIGYSYNNNSIPLIILTNEQIQDDLKGKTYVVAHHHAREQITIEHTLRTIRDLVNKYNDGDLKTISLLNQFVIYFIVTLNPDSLDYVLYENEWQRKTLRPYDDDGDGKIDEDGPEDLNTDGRITGYYVYYWNETEDNWVYQYEYMEGIDNDGDGLFNEDRIGGVDLNRNYPFHWNDSSADSGTGNDKSSYTWPGPEPASENETRALINFVTQHNFTHALSLHSGTNITLFDWSYTNEVHQVEAPMYETMENDFRIRGVLPISFFLEENDLDYTSAGEWGDWTYATQHTIPLTLEIYHQNGSEYLDYVSHDGFYYTFERTKMFEYFNPPEDKIESLHQELLSFEEYWLSLTPWIEFVSSETLVTSNTNKLIMKLKSGSWYFNTTDKAIVSINPSVDGIITDYPNSIDPLQPKSITRYTITLSKEVPQDFYFDINISSQWASDLHLRIEVIPSDFERTIGFDAIIVLTSLVIMIPIIRRNRKGSI